MNSQSFDTNQHYLTQLYWASKANKKSNVQALLSFWRFDLEVVSGLTTKIVLCYFQNLLWEWSILFFILIKGFVI